MVEGWGRKDPRRVLVELLVDRLRATRDRAPAVLVLAAAAVPGGTELDAHDVCQLVGEWVAEAVLPPAGPAGEVGGPLARAMRLVLLLGEVER